VRTGERLRLLTRSVTDLADMLEAAVNGPRELDRELLQLVADALRQAALFGGGLRNARPLVTVAEYEDVCDEAACLRRALYEVAGHRVCRPHALDTALGSLRLSGPPRRPGVGD